MISMCQSYNLDSKILMQTTLNKYSDHAMCPCQNENFGHAGINAEMEHAT